MQILTRVLNRLAFWLGVTIAVQFGLLLNDFYSNAYEQAWYQEHYLVLYAILINPWPTLAIAGSFMGILIGLILLQPWTPQTRGLETTGAGSGPVAAQVSAPGEAVAVPVPPPLQPLPLTVAEKIQKRMGEVPKPDASGIAGPTNRNQALKPPDTTVPKTGPSPVAKLLGNRHEDFTVGEERVKYRFNWRRIRFEPKEP